MAALVLLALIGAVVAYIYLKSGETIRFETSSTPRQVTMAAVGVVGAKRRWQTLSQGDGSANFAYQKGANWFIAVLLLLFFIAPGVVYLVLAGKKEALAINTDESTVGMTVVQVGSNGWRGKYAGRGLRSQLALATGSLAHTPAGQRHGSVSALEAPDTPAVALDRNPEPAYALDGVRADGAMGG